VKKSTANDNHDSPPKIFAIFLRLGCMSFGGPIAHLGYFRTEFVERRRWLPDDSFAELVALAQSMPGPASSQVGYGLGLLRAGVPGGIAAWLGFTLPSTLLMLAFAFGHNLFAGKKGVAVLHGLQLIAVAVVAQAVVSMQKKLAPDRDRLLLAAMAAAIVLFTSASFGTLLAIAVGVICGLLFLRSGGPPPRSAFSIELPKRAGAIAAAAFALLLLAALLLPENRITAVSVFANFARTGALVFGGGHVVLPLLEQSVVAKGWISQSAFLSGYGAAQALPGPLFSFAAFLGAAVRPNAHPLLLGLSALVAIFSPGLLLITAVLPIWDVLRTGRLVQAALKGVNASVVGVLTAALIRPVWTSAIQTRADFCVALSAFAFLVAFKLQPVAVVLAVALLYWLGASVLPL
jgi:chromate transporter